MVDTTTKNEKAIININITIAIYYFVNITILAMQWFIPLISIPYFNYTYAVSQGVIDK